MAREGVGEEPGDGQVSSTHGTYWAEDGKAQGCRGPPRDSAQRGLRHVPSANGHSRPRGQDQRWQRRDTVSAQPHSRTPDPKAREGAHAGSSLPLLRAGRAARTENSAVPSFIQPEARIHEVVMKTLRKQTHFRFSGRNWDQRALGTEHASEKPRGERGPGGSLWLEAGRREGQEPERCGLVQRGQAPLPGFPRACSEAGGGHAPRGPYWGGGRRTAQPPGLRLQPGRLPCSEESHSPRTHQRAAGACGGASAGSGGTASQPAGTTVFGVEGSGQVAPAQGPGSQQTARPCGL